MNTYKNLCLAFVLVIFFVQYTNGQDLKINHGPYIQYVTTNEVNIVWSTSHNCISWVEFYENDGSNFYQEEREKIFASSDGLKTISKLHKISIKNLKPSISYAYRIFSKEVKKNGSFGNTVATRVYKRKPLYFSTQKVDKEQTSCIILSDMHGNSQKLGKLLKGVEWGKTDFVVLNGDFMNSFQNEINLYSGILDTCVKIFAKETPICVVRGNHETRGLKAPELKKYFYFPENKYYYTFSSGTTFFIVLDCGEDKPDSDIEYSGLADFDLYRSEQAQWLSEVVKSAAFQNARHIIVFIHIPPYDDKRGNEWHGTIEVREKFVHILNQSGIDLMLCGHTHSYSLVPKNDGENNFPIIISDNESRIDLFIDNTGIKVKRVDADSKVLSEMFFKKNE
jgi:acid phosphatase type 7